MFWCAMALFAAAAVAHPTGFYYSRCEDGPPSTTWPSSVMGVKLLGPYSTPCANRGLADLTWEHCVALQARRPYSGAGHGSLWRYIGYGGGPVTHVSCQYYLHNSQIMSVDAGFHGGTNVYSGRFCTDGTAKHEGGCRLQGVMLLLLLLLLLPLPPSRRRCLPNAESSPAMLTPQPLPALRCAHTGEGGSHWYSEQWCNCGRSACPADIGCDRDQRWQSVGSDGKGCGKLLCSCDTISAALRKPAPALWTGSGCTWACPAGYAGASEVQPVASACTACPAGTFGKSGKCTACPVGQHTAESTDAAAATVHQICIGGGARTEFPSSTTFGFTAACRKAGSNHRSCDDHSFGANAQACYTACRKLGKTGCCTFRAHLVSTAGGGNGCFFIEGGTRSGNGNSDIWSGLMTAPAYGALQVPGAPC